MSARLTGPVRAVLFDVDGTLYLQPPLRMAMACELAVTSLATGWVRRPHDVPLLRAFRRVREQLRADDGSPEPLASRQYTAVSAGIGCHPTDVERAVAEWIHRRPLKWLRFCRRRGLDRFFEFLSARGVRCGVFSDYPVREKLVALRLADRFDLLLSAEDREVDAFKPNPRGFLRASERWGIPVREIVYVGDRSEVDAVGAASAGMQCAVLTTRRPRGNAAFVAVADFRELQRVLDPVC